MRLDLRKQIGDKDMKIETVLEQALHLETVTIIEEEEQTPKIAIIRRDETKNLVEAVNKLVNQLSVDNKQRQNSRNLSRERSSSRGRWHEERCDRGQQQIVGSTIGSYFQRHDLVTGTGLSEQMKRLGGTTGRVSVAEHADTKDKNRDIVEIVAYVEVPNT